MLGSKFGFFLSIFLIFSCPLFANYGDSFGIGTRNNFLGGSADVTDGGAFASVGNPAGLIISGKAPIDISFRTNNPSLTNTNLTFSNPPPTGLPPDSYQAQEAGNMNSISGGGNLQLGERVVVGGSVLMPTDAFARVYAFSGNEANNLHYMDRQSRPELYSAAAVRILDWFSIGAGFFASVSANGTLQTGITQSNAEARVLLELTPMIVPYGGVLFERPVGNGNLLLGSAYRAEHNANTDLTVDMNFDLGIGRLPFSADSQLIAFYDPAKFSIGLGYVTVGQGIYISAENLYWSGYKSSIIKLGGPDLGVLTNGQGSTTPIKLQDAWTFKAGYEIKNWAKVFSAGITNQFGFEFAQSALPENPSSLTILDSDRFSINTGFSLGFPGIKEFVDKPISINLGAKWTHLFPKNFSITDSTGNTMTAQIGGEVFSLIAGFSFEI